MLHKNPLYLGLLAYLHCYVASQDATTRVRVEGVLKAPYTMIRDQHAVPGQSIYYQLDGLEDVDYDIWISYPATTPADFTVDILRPHEVTSKDLEASWRTFPQRRPLNTHKVSFKHEMAHPHTIVRISVQSTGIPVPTSFHVPETVEIPFNMVLDRSSYGIPHRVWDASLLILAVLMGGYFFLIPLVNDQLNDYLK